MVRALKCILILCCIFVGSPNEAYAKKSTFYVGKILDYPQGRLRKIIKNFDKGGFCAPTAASNILRTFHAKRSMDQGELIKLLASPEYMNTDPNRGTEIYNFLKGLAKYTDTHLNGYKEIKYQGIGNYREFNTGQQIPQLDWITGGLGMKKGTWLLIHMLKHDPKKDEYRFVGGHLITLTGYNVGARNNILMVNDSAAPDGESSKTESLHVKTIESGHFVLGNQKMPATGFLKIDKGQRIRYGTDEPYDTIVITGAIRLEAK